MTAGEAKKWARYVDRTDQITDMARFLGAEWLTSRFGEGGFTGRDDTPIVVILTCTSEDRHRYLRHRFEEGESVFDPESDYASILTGIQIHDIQFVGDEPKGDVDHVLLLIKERLRSLLSAVSVDPEAIQSALNDRHAPQVMFSTITSKSGTIGSKRQKLVKNWIEFWQQVAGGSDQDRIGLNHPVIVILSVVTDAEEPAEAKGRRPWLDRFFGREALDRPLSQWAEDLSRTTGGTLRHESFTELDLVNQSDVETWIKCLARLFTELKPAADEALIDVPALIPVKGVTMAEFVDIRMGQLSILERTGITQ